MPSGGGRLRSSVLANDGKGVWERVKRANGFLAMEFKSFYNEVQHTQVDVLYKSLNLML
jgi:hypothetical protein